MVSYALKCDGTECGVINIMKYGVKRRMEKNRIRPIKSGRSIRMTYQRQNEVLEIPNLIEVQKASYDWFVNEGLREVFDDISPIEDFSDKHSLVFNDYKCFHLITLFSDLFEQFLLDIWPHLLSPMTFNKQELVTSFFLVHIVPTSMSDKYPPILNRSPLEFIPRHCSFRLQI